MLHGIWLRLHLNLILGIVSKPPEYWIGTRMYSTSAVMWSGSILSVFSVNSCNDLLSVRFIQLTTIWLTATFLYFLAFCFLQHCLTLGIREPPQHSRSGWEAGSYGSPANQSSSPQMHEDKHYNSDKSLFTHTPMHTWQNHIERTFHWNNVPPHLQVITLHSYAY